MTLPRNSVKCNMHSGPNVQAGDLNNNKRIFGIMVVVTRSKIKQSSLSLRLNQMCECFLDTGKDN